MRRAGILIAGLIFLILPVVSNAGALIISVDIVTKVDTSKVEGVWIECNVYNVHRGVVGYNGSRLPLDNDGIFIGRFNVTIKPLHHLGGVADLLANATDYKCFYTVKKRGENSTPLFQESDIPDGLESYWGHGHFNRPFRPTVSGRVEW